MRAIYSMERVELLHQYSASCFLLRLSLAISDTQPTPIRNRELDGGPSLLPGSSDSGAKSGRGLP